MGSASLTMTWLTLFFVVCACLNFSESSELAEDEELIRPDSFNCNKCDLCAKCSQCKLCKICDLFTTEFKPCKQCAKCSLCNDCKYCKTCSKEELAVDTKGRKGLENLFDESQRKKFLQEVYWNVILNRK